MASVLVAEDDKNIRLLTTLRLKSFYTVESAENGQEAFDIIQNKNIDILVADIMMPQLDGFALVKKLRENNNNIPVIMLTAKQTIADKRTGFALGIDDYLTKPVNYEELVMRIDAVLRRSRIATEKRICIGDSILDSASYTVSYNDKEIELPKKEFDLLYKMLSYPGEIFTKTQLLESIWGNDSESSEDTIKTHISRLRNKFADCKDFSIETLRGLGYKALVTNA